MGTSQYFGMFQNLNNSEALLRGRGRCYVIPIKTKEKAEQDPFLFCPHHTKSELIFNYGVY